MPDTSPALGLPFILPSQAQKHVTHNEAITELDALVQAVVEARDQTAPPASPAAGARYIVAAGATGDWAGHDNAIAYHDGTAWLFYGPIQGWRAHVLAEARMVTYDATDGWQDSSVQNLEVANLGINAAADANNRLTVSSAATLLNHEGAGHQLKLNKAAVTDTASLLFQTGFSGRAEMGTAGSDDFAIKVSNDGASWTSALTVAAADGSAAVTDGFSIGGQAAYHRGNILGSVSESAGTPTGAVIERGTNANGDYVRFADGTQICTSVNLVTGPVTTASGALYVSASLIWTFPAGFIAAPVVAGESGNTIALLGIGNHGSVSVSFRAIAGVSFGSGLTARLTATGRWF